jgi:hypothetical protein
MASLGCLHARRLVPGTAVRPCPLEQTEPAPCGKLLAPVLALLLGLSSWRAGGAHPGGAHEATRNEVEAVDLVEDQAHQLGHEFVHPPLSVFVFVLCFQGEKENFKKDRENEERNI